MEQKAAHTSGHPAALEVTLNTDSTPPEFRHTPEAPVVHASHPRQRYFRQHHSYQDGPRVTLLRMAGDRRATFETKAVEWDGNGDIIASSSLRVHLTADDLLVLARACIDAAHDLQANPPHVLEAA